MNSTAKNAKNSKRDSDSAPSAFSAVKKKNPPPSQILVFADVVPIGGGEFKVIPRKPKDEITVKEFAKLLGYKTRSAICALFNDPLGRKLLHPYRRSAGGRTILLKRSEAEAYKAAVEAKGLE